MKSIYTIFILFFVHQFMFAQHPPWNAKFIVYHPDGYTDTLWVGCDENATDGFDEGLDLLDNTFEYPISIGAFSPEVDAEFNLDNCVNLKREILPFADVRQYTFYIVYDDSPGLPPQIKWDSTDYLYEDGEYMMAQASLYAQTGYLEAINGTNATIFNRLSDDFSDYNFFYTNYIDIFSETAALECIPQDNVIKIRLAVIFKDYSLAVNQTNFSSQIYVYPNPMHDYFYLKNSSNNLVNIFIKDLQGSVLFSYQNIYGDVINEDVNSLTPGYYLIEVIDLNTQLVNVFSIIKL
ncbi:MAG: T9SS type A sorting domain-containing protein [Bacteroidetes bacterium]|nr:T9SS type A sorting domain-containing protein [Bacteroidota bacterium]MBK8487147.1 T9SS type A sorting domain-containing protein [Bacteroidota bacterium]